MTERRIPFVCGNWKMHKTIGEALGLADALVVQAGAIVGVEVAVAPPFTALHAVSKRIGGSSIRLAAQNVHQESQGAYTGEISAAMLKEIGCRYVIIGHSERRTLFGETDEACGRKVGAALRAGVAPILCVGETLAERDAGRTLEVVGRQLLAGLEECAASVMPGVVVAYEPVWAIGTGRTATPGQAQEVHAYLRERLASMFGQETAAAVRIQYGGSVKPNNARDLFSQADIDGGLIGGASLVADDFLAICRAARPV